MKRHWVKFPWDLYLENKTYKLNRFIARVILFLFFFPFSLRYNIVCFNFLLLISLISF